MHTCIFLHRIVLIEKTCLKILDVAQILHWALCSFRKKRLSLLHSYSFPYNKPYFLDFIIDAKLEKEDVKSIGIFLL